MDLNHDYIDKEPFLLMGAQERLQMCKCAILSMGDMGYTDPPLPSIKEFIGEYTDEDANKLLESRIRQILEVGELAAPDEILSISVSSPIGGGAFTVDLRLSFASEVFDVPTIL